jgi:aspartate/methionine/tyrosine aminotransferase
MFINAPTISQTAALKCWDDDTVAELETHIEKYRTSRSIILSELAQIPEIESKNIAPADGGFYVYIHLGEENTAPGFGSVNMCKALLEEEHVAFTPGTDFEDPSGDLGDRRFRISYAGGAGLLGWNESGMLNRSNFTLPTRLDTGSNYYGNFYRLNV